MRTERHLSDVFLETHPEDAAFVLERLAAGDVAALLAEVPPPVAAEVLGRMALPSGADCLARLAPERAGSILAALSLDRAAGLLRRAGVETAERALAAMAADTAATLRRLLEYPEGTAGAIMDPQVPALPLDVAVGDALARVRRSPRHVLYYLYVADRDHHLVGVVNLRELMLAPAKAMLAEVMRSEVARLSARAGRAEIVSHPGWGRFHALPVVDDGGTFVGVIRYETVRMLEQASQQAQPAEGGLAAFLSLGELVWVGLVGVLDNLASGVALHSAPPGTREEGDHGTRS